jgi:hypothetical protein
MQPTNTLRVPLIDSFGRVRMWHDYPGAGRNKDGDLVRLGYPVTLFRRGTASRTRRMNRPTPSREARFHSPHSVQVRAGQYSRKGIIPTRNHRQPGCHIRPERDGGVTPQAFPRKGDGAHYVMLSKQDMFPQVLLKVLFCLRVLWEIHTPLSTVNHI